MPLSNSIIRRYTPPSCTLQIVTSSSPQSRWGGQQVNNVLRFELHFDDPQIPEERRVTIEGDRDQLQALHQAVTTYVQNLLRQSPERFNALVSAPSPSSPEAAVASSPASSEVSLPPRDISIDLSLEPITPKNPTAPSRKIFLRPGSGLAHDLMLGTLATKESGPVIHLSVLQLFDLATALDEYAADMVVPGPSRSRVASTLPAWGKIAVVLLLAVGLTTAAALLLNQKDQKQQTARKTTPQTLSSNNLPQTSLQPSPLPTLSSPEKLPLPPLASTFPTGNSKPASPLSVPGAPTGLRGTLPGNVPKLAPTFKGGADSLINPITPGSPIVINPGSSQTVPGRSSTQLRRSGSRQSTVGVAPMPFPPLPATIPSPLPPIAPTNPLLSPPVASDITPLAEPSRKPKVASSQNSAALRGTPTPSSSTPAASNESKTTAFDTVPQVAEVRNYFKQHWEPPSGLTQTLEYSLVLDTDGTIQKIEPLGQAARTYVDQTSMPLIGDPFVSPNKSGQSPRVRVVLSPDGNVQTFLESDK